MLLLGDCHGLTDRYTWKIENLEGDGIRSILLGELGFKPQHDWFLQSPLSKHNKILFGNHDHFPYLHTAHYSLGRFKFLKEHNMFAIAGAYSIDKHHRRAGVTWFEEEEMNTAEENNCMGSYKRALPDMVISHDAPATAIDAIFKYDYKYPGGDRTNKFFDKLLEAHRPRVWVFAHHHDHRDAVIDGTRFICLDELETLDTDTLK